MYYASPEQLEPRFSPEVASKDRLAIIKDGLSLIENSALAMGLDEVNEWFTTQEQSKQKEIA